MFWYVDDSQLNFGSLYRNQNVSITWALLSQSKLIFQL